jgi:meso-butanediol dehydrogenase/(S,S)-butanediol dehydrogenase/diacetyl reductase
MTEYPNKVALITGAGREKGIGAAIARRLAREGVNVVLGDLCAPPAANPVNPGGGQWATLQAIAEEIEGSAGVEALPVQVDVTDPDSIATMLEMALAAFGRLDILVNNAGVAVGPAPVAQMDKNAWRKTLEVNLTGAFFVTQAALPALIQTAGQHGRGRIINMSSLAAARPKPFLSAYAASKAGVIAFTQSLAQEIAQFGVTANALLPGDIDTDFKRWGLQLESMVRGQEYDAVVQAAIAQIPVGRLGTPEDVAAMVAFLCSEDADFITGQAINITGGRELVQAVMPR